MKIAYFIDHLRPDGTQFVLKQLVVGMQARGHTQLVICLNDSWDETFRQSLIQSGAEVRIVGKLSLATGWGWLLIQQWLRRGNFDVAVTLLFVSDVVGRLSAHLAKVPRIVTSLQTHDVNYTWWQRRLVRFTMRYADEVLLNSEHFREFAIAGEGAPSDRLVVIHNSIRLEGYQQPVDRAALRAELGVRSGEVLLGSVGRLVPQKGFDVLLQALVLIPRTDLRLLIVGVGPDEARLRAQAAELGVQDRVQFAGYRRDVPALMHCFDLYTHASRFEGMPIVVLEAMASGCPVVATAVDGTRELIEDGVHGWLVPPENPALLADAIHAALRDPNLAQQRAAAAYQRVREQFGEDALMIRWEGAFAGKL
jgi:glycosyltransferase involved in cell wall biosynthesis